MTKERTCYFIFRKKYRTSIDLYNIDKAAAVEIYIDETDQKENRMNIAESFQYNFCVCFYFCFFVREIVMTKLV